MTSQCSSGESDRSSNRIGSGSTPDAGSILEEIASRIDELVEHLRIQDHTKGPEEVLNLLAQKLREPR